MSVLGDLVREERKRRGLTLQQLADAAGFSAAYISDIEKGNRRPTTDTFLSGVAGPLGIESDIVYYYAGRIPPDLRNLDVSEADVVGAFAAFRAVLNGTG